MDAVCWEEVPFCEELCRPAAILAYRRRRRENNGQFPEKRVSEVWPRGGGENGSSMLADLLRGGQALQLSRAEAVLLLESLQHQVLLLSGVHLLQVLRRRVRPVQRLLEHLRGRSEGSGYAMQHKS